MFYYFQCALLPLPCHALHTALPNLLTRLISGQYYSFRINFEWIASQAPICK